MKGIVLFTTLSFYCFFSSCVKTAKENRGGIRHKRYFDLAHYFEEESERLQGKVTARKVVIFNSKREERFVNDIDFKQELKMFSNVDINRPAWSDKYTIDSLWGGNNDLVGLRYKCLEKDLKTQQLAIDFIDGKVVNIEAHVSSNSSIASSKIYQNYRPNWGYSVENRQKIIGSDEAYLKSTVMFVE